MRTLTRQELYDLIWSTPMTKLAESFGISDVGLAKICDRHRVPTPPRGYWAQKEAGKKVKQTIFVKADDPLLDRINIAATGENLPEPVREIIEQRRAERKASRPTRPAKTILTPPPTERVTDPHPAIQATVTALRRAQPSKPGIVEAIGPGLCGISVSIKSIERVIFVLDRLARTCETRGLTLIPRDNRIAARSATDEVTFVINEKPKQVAHVLTEAEIVVEEESRKRIERRARGRIDWDVDPVFAPLPPKFDIIRTGELGLQVYGWGDGLRCNWNDGKTQVLETMIDDIVDGFEAHIATIRLRRETQEKAQAERREIERRRGLVKARLERDVERKRLLRKLIRTEREAQQLREWIARYEQSALPNPDPDLNRMIDWARDRLATMEASLNASKLADDLRSKRLFPEVDELIDPLGDPPPAPRWY